MFDVAFASMYGFGGIEPSKAVFAWIVGFAVTIASVYYIKKRATLDVPSERSMHKTPTPRGGGLGIAIGFLGTALFLLGDSYPSRSLLYPLIIGAIPILAVGWADDRGHVSPTKRAAVHLISCCAAFVSIWLLNSPSELFLTNTNLVWIAIATIASAYFLNLYNFMDGIDGLAATEGAFVALAATAIHRMPTEPSFRSSAFEVPDLPPILSGETTTTALLGFCCLGFLIWNWPPAKIFMGDVGSGFLGFVFAFLALTSTGFHQSTGVATAFPGIALASSIPWTWLILLGVFIVDGTYTLAVRALTGQKWYEAHSLHSFQKAAKRTSHLAVTLSVLAINLLWLAPIAAYAHLNPGNGLSALLIAYAPLVVIAWRLRAGLIESNISAATSVAQ